MDSNQDFGSILNSFSGSSPSGPKQDADGIGSLLNSYGTATTQPTRSVSDQSVGGGNVDEFVKSVAPAAQRVAQRLNVPVEAVIGQWGLETGWGKSVIPGTNNLGNIKSTNGNGVAATDNQTGSRDKYRQYGSVDEFADDFSNLVGGGRYKAVSGSRDPQSYFQNLQSGGYAEAKDYVQVGTKASAMAAEALKRAGVAPVQQSSTAPDLSKAPKWADVVAKPEFAALSPEKKAEAKAAYFDVYIAPHAGQQSGALRQQFMAKSDDPGFMDKALGVAKDIGGAIVDAVKPAKSVMEGQTMAAPELPTTSKVPVKPEVRAAFNAAWDSATPEQRAIMQGQEGWTGMLARERAGVFERSDANATPTTAKLDPRIEARVQRLVAAGEDPRFAERAAREAAAAGVMPGREIEFMQKGGGLAQKSEFDFDTKQLFDQKGGTNGLNNPLARGVAKGGLGLAKAGAGYMQFLGDVLGADAATADMKAAGNWARGKEQAIGESGSFMERNFEGAISSIAQQLPLLITGTKLESEAVPLAGMAVQSFGQEYSDGRAAGQSVGEATTRASIFAAFEVIGEKFGLKDSMQAIKAAARGMPSDQIVGFLWSALKKEVPGELLTTTGQFGADKLPGGVGLNPNATGADYLKQVADTVAQTIMQSGVMAGGTTGVSKAIRTIRDNGPSEGVANADAELVRQQVLNKWNTNGLNSRIEPTMGTPATASVTPDGRIEPKLNPTAEQSSSVQPAEPAGAPAIHPTSQTADSIVRELAQQAGIPETTVLPTPAPDVSLTNEGNMDGALTDEGTSDQDVQDFAASRYQQLREKRDGAMQTVMGENGAVDQDVPGTGLSAAERQELNGLERARGDVMALRGLYGFDQIPSDQSQFANQAQVPVPAAGMAEQPTAGETFPATTEPGLVAAQENQNVETQQQGQAVGPALDQGAVVTTGQPGGPASQQEPAVQASAAQIGAEPGQRLEGLPAQDAVSQDADIPLGAPSNVSEADAMRSLGFSEDEIQAATGTPAPAKPKTEKEAKARRSFDPTGWTESENTINAKSGRPRFPEGVKRYTKTDEKGTHTVIVRNGEVTQSSTMSPVIELTDSVLDFDAPVSGRIEVNNLNGQLFFIGEGDRGSVVKMSPRASQQYKDGVLPIEQIAETEFSDAGGIRPDGSRTPHTTIGKLKGKTDGTQAPQAQQAKAQGQEAPAARAVKPDEPPLSGGMTRLYHGSATQGRYDGPAWFSTSRDYASNYRDGAELQYVDVPTDRINKLADPDGYGQTPAKGFTFNAEFDSADVGKRKPLVSAPAKPKTEKEAKAKREQDDGQRDELDAEMRSYEAKAERANWWNKDLSIFGRRMVMKAAGVSYPESVQWDRIKPAAREKLWSNRAAADQGSKTGDAMSQGTQAAKSGARRTPPAGLTDKAAFEWMQGYDGQAGTTPASQQPKTDTSKFAGNKLFTEDAVEKARARLRSKLGNMNSGIDPEVMVDGVTLAGAYIEAGVRKYSDYAKAMVGDFGEKIRPYLRSFYEGVRHYPGLDTTGMTTAAEIDLAEKQGTAEHTKPAPGTEEAIGQKVAAPKRTMERKAGESTLRDDYGVSSIDGYDGNGEKPSGPIKTQFLADTRKYLSDVAAALQAKGFTPQNDRKGKSMKPVNVNESGVAGSGDVSLTMFHPDMQRGIYITIGGTALRGVVPSTKSGVQVMMRVTKDGDPYGGDKNRWMPVNLTSTELAFLAAQEVEKITTNSAQSSVAKPAAQAQNTGEKESTDGNAQRSDGSTTGRAEASSVQVETAAVSDERTPVDLAGGKPVKVQEAGQRGQVAANAEKPESPTANGERVPERPTDAARQPDGKAANGRTAADTVASNFTITDELNFAGQGAKTKYGNNVAAIRLLKQLETEGRQATAAEQAVLAKYIGWGGMPQAFDPKNDKWAKEFAELKQLLTADEYGTAASSTRNAHYTAKPVVEAIWTGLRRIGFTNGSVLEPSMGSGNFFGLMPVDARAKSRLFGVEFDHITGGIAKQLYPQAKINAPIGFQDIKLAAETFDVATGNPPFGDESLYDKNHPDASKFKIHGFFFAKSVDTLKPGGVLAMVVSKGLMDANDPRGKAARAWLAERTRLLGAIRLPNSAFQENANTEVTTDIIFLQKLSDEVKPNTGEWNAMGEVKDKATGQPIAINKYFVANPDMMLGEMTLAGSMYRANEPTLSARDGDNLPDLLAKAIEKLPEGVFKTGNSTFIEAADKTNKVSTADNVREHGYFLKDGKLFQRMPDYNGERQSVEVAKEGKELERITGMIGLRDAVRKQLALEKNAASTDKEIEANRQALNKAYDDFVKKYGYLNAQTNKRLFADDSDAALLLSLEGKWDKGVTEAVAKTTGQKPRQAKATKATIFTKRVQTPVASVTKANTAKEAMLASLNERGRIDREFMANLYGKSFDDIVAELGDLVFEEPGSGWVPADLYLSGNVKQALAAARKAAEVDARFERNVVALMKVQPADINPSDIFVKIGSPWVALEDYNAFVKETFGGKVAGAFLASTGNWSVTVDRGTPTETNTTWGTERMGAHRIVETLMGNKQVAVYDEYKDADGNTKRVLNADDTAAAQGKADALAEAFQDWIWKDNERRERLSRAYNDTYNTNIKRTYDGSHLTLPGMNTAIELRPHQLNWVYRSLVEGKGLADHVVGAGKTFAIIAAMMEMRRLGLANKPMIVVPNHLVGQWAKDILALYPGANVLAASRKDFQKDRRKLLFSRIATGDWDMVVVAHSSFGRIPVPAETEQRILDDQLSELIDAIQQAKADKGARFTVKDLEKAKVRIEEKLKKLADRKQDDALDFADLGVDALSVDEAHEFKNLFYTTTLQGVAGLGSPQGSTRAFDMFVKTRYVSERAGGKNVFFATGTPVANSIAEVFHMQRFLQYDTLKARGIHNFDAWANTFGQSTSDWEMNAAGKFVQKTRFRKFANLPELKGIWGEVADTVTRADLIADAEKQGKRFPLPKVKTGKPQNVVTDRSQLQAEFIGVPQQEMDDNGKPKVDDNGQPIMKFKPGTIVHRLENWKEASKTNPKEIPLAITGQARKAGLDYRLIDENAPDFEGSKINAAVSRIYNTWKANDARKGTQLVFCDLSVPASAKGQATADAAAKTPTFFLRVNGGETLQHVSGVPLTLQAAPDFQFFTHKTGKLYQVIERTSGLTLADGRTKADAVDVANAKMARADLAVFAKNVERRSIPTEAIDDYITRWEEQQAQAEDTGTDDESAESTKEISLDEMLADGGGTFSVYDDIKAKLIAQGMPAEQIAFIHDYNTDDKKAALFAAVNGGDIRVLLGSTQKMGAGTNVQAKLVALHHMDAPWRPSDLEQREGRIIRQGNEFYEADPDGFEVDIYRYATKQTYDSRMWEIIETKARAIEQFKSDSSMREIEDVSSESANAAEIKAGASGNPLILDAITLAAELRKLQAMKKSWDRSRFDLEKKIQQATDKTGWVYNGAQMAEAFAATVQPKNKDKLGINVFGLNINAEKDVTADALASKMIGAATDSAGKKVGQYRGVDLYVRRDTNGVTFFTSYRDHSVSSTTYGQADKFSVSGFLTRMDNLVEGAAKWKDSTAEAVVQFEKDAENAKKELAKGFPKEEELKSVGDKHKAVVAALRAGKTSLEEDAPGRLADFTRSPSMAYMGTPDPVRVNARQKLEKLGKKLDAGQITESEYVLAAREITAKLNDQREEREYRQATGGRRRGADWIVSKLRLYVADQAIDREVANFAEWLIDQNPNVANDLGIGMTTKGDVAGDYNDGSRVFRLIAGRANTGTAVHEILHHTERMMPKEVQDGVLREWQRAWEAAHKAGDAKLKKALEDMVAASLGSKTAYDRVQAAFNDGTLVYDQHYQLFSPSEFWAVNATRIMSGRYAAKGSWVKRAVQWFKEFIERVKGVFGLPSDAPILKALKAVMTGDGQFQPDAQMLVDRAGEKTSREGERTFNDITRRTQNNLMQFFGNQDKSLKTFGLYHKTLSTQYNKALKDRNFGKVFGLVNAMQNEVSLTSIRPAELAPGILPRVDDVTSAAKQLVKGKKADAQLTKAAGAIFAGTLDGANVMEGRVWTEAELRSNFGMDDVGVALYEQGRAAIDASLDELAAAEAYAMAQTLLPKAMRRQIIDNPRQAEGMVVGEIKKQIKTIDTAIRAAKRMGNDQHAAELRAARQNYTGTLRQVEKIFVTAKNLKAAGYAPLMRFGKFTVTVQKIDTDTGNVARDENGESLTEFYGQYETEGEAKMVKRQMDAKYADRDDIRVSAGTKSQTSHELYAGISPETLALFAEAIGADNAMKKYIELAMTERSALKRRLERKGTAGYSEDLPRVLSNFITSNGRFAAQRYYLRDLNNAIKFIPKEKGDVLDEAMALKKFVMDPQDSGSVASAVMFTWFLGGSVASAIVNLSQPVMMTAPYLSQFGVPTATKALATALPLALGKKQITDTVLRDALKRASQEGIVDAQEIFHLYSVGAQGAATGLVNALSKVPVVGDKIKEGSESARARITAFGTLWGSMFSLAEGFNRKLTFIAAWEVAKANGEKNPYAFAVRAVNETQGIYNKVNRPNWARGTVGRTVLTFKQFSLMYLELLNRMWKYGGPEGKRAALVMLAVLMLASGEEGLPFAQDLDDLIDTVGQLFGLDTNMKRNKRRLAHEILGKALGDMFLYGVSSQLPLDFAGRLGLGNLIPGTAMLKPSAESGRTREVAEVFGPSAGLLTQIGDAYDAAAEGNWGKAAQNLAPTAVKNLAAGLEMAKKGYATDTKGRKVTETTGTDAAFKSIGFNPTVVAEETRKTTPVFQDIALQKKTESSIVDQWAQARVDNDEAGMAKAMKRLEDWNQANPGTPIKIDNDQLRNKARQLATDKDSRLLKSAPREMRGRVGLDLAK